MSNNLNECDDTFWNGSILGYWLKYTHTRKELLLICRVVSRFTSVRVGILQYREKSHNFYEITVLTRESKRVSEVSMSHSSAPERATGAVIT
ncbi:hypothetical protein, partial [Escherichia coli]|uniref:hypothetical protein n=1 Tax=Escherichia coli TaxID=562 RepID=UPI001B3C7C32